MKKCQSACTLAFLFVVSGIVIWGLMGSVPNAAEEAKLQGCEWKPGDPHKMHYPQLPDEAGWDVNATAPVMLADDWQCSESGPVKDFHFWGSWKGGIVGQITGFQIRIYSDIPVDPPQIEYSRPGSMLWEAVIEDFEVVQIDPATMEGWYDPVTGEVLWNDHQQYFQYNICLTENQWFDQVAGTIYWLSISAILADAQTTQWGWKSTQDHFNDDAVVGIDGVLDWEDLWEPAEPLINEFGITIGPGGGFGGGGGSDAYGAGWYFYPDEDWWNIWFYDHPFDPERKKNGFIEFDVDLVDPSQAAYFEIAVNWSTDLWSIEQPPGDSAPPLPGVPELPYIGRLILFAGEQFEGHYILPYEIPDYNPEWVSVDVRGFNFTITGGVIQHSCLGSLDLSFVITNQGFMEEPEACCLPDGSCADLLPTDCINQGGAPQGPGTVCTAAEACCLPDGSCIMADPLCCIDRSGAPQGVGTACSQFEACCMPDGSCMDLDPLCCVDQGGTPQGAGTACTGVTIACCLPDGSCQTVEAQCCDELGGTPSPIGATGCLGDNNGNQIDDACEQPSDDGACCLPDGSCTVVDAATCQSQGGTFKGPGTHCFGDSNGNGVDDACESPWNPEDGHKMHYPQLPDEAGWDVMNMYPSILADDWMCSESGPVKDLHFWGSWLHGATGRIRSFTIRIYSDIPVDPPMIPYSRPGELLWENDIYNFNSTPIIPQTPEGWFNPSTGLILPDDHVEYWQYDVYLPEEQWFIQEQGRIYWLSITANLEPPDPVYTEWGWKSSINHWNDDAVWKEWMIYCVAPDNGLGTADLPPAQCPYYGYGDVMQIVEGLPPGTTIDIDPTLDNYSNVNRFAGGTLGGEVEQFQATLTMAMAGTGTLTGYLRNIAVPVDVEFHHAPRANGDPVQDMLATVYFLAGGIVGDPDFNTLTFTAGDGNGLPSPGETKLTRLPDGTWHVDSFFDITYRIDFQGAPGGVLDGLSGSTIGTVRMKISGDQTGDWFELREPPEFQVSMDLSFVITNGIVEDTCDQQYPGDVNNDGTIDINDVTYLVAYIKVGGPAPPIQANGDVNGDCCIDMWDVVDLNAFLFAGGPAPVLCTCVNPPLCDCFIGDANADGAVNIGDAVYIISYAFRGGPAPTPYPVCSGDANCDCLTNIGDAVFIISYVFRGGPRPCSCCDWVAACGPPHAGD